jgi:RNA polymerase sigma-70 factor (ECF subfamily)
MAEEVVQDVFLSVFRARHTYRDESAFRPWITVMARHRLIDLHRAHATQSWGQGAEVEELVDDADSLEVSFIKNEERAILENGLTSLKELDRELLVLWMDDFSYEEISEVVGKSVAAVKFALHQAKKKLIEHAQNRSQS